MFDLNRPFVPFLLLVALVLSVLAGCPKPPVAEPPLPPIPEQIQTSDGRPRSGHREPGVWCRENGVVPPAGSFGYSDAVAAPEGVA